MSSNSLVTVEKLSKCYNIYDQPADRLKQSVIPRLQRLMGQHPKHYGREFWALKDISFEVGKGETIGIIGRNGSGKSTLLQVICGTVSPTSGIAKSHGRIAALLELGAGFNPEFSGRENVFLNAAILGFPQEIMSERMEKVLAFSELGDFLDQPVKTYSSGMYARLAFSIAIHVDPEILIVDEALAVGDARFVAKCMRRIKDIQDQGTTILFVSHDVGTVRTLCDRAIWLDKGHMVEDGDVFPVSGRYMEFMFKDEESEEESLRKTIIAQQHTPIDASERASQDQPCTPDGPHSERVYGGMLSPTLNPEMDARPVTHWGSRKGLIKSAFVGNEHEHKIDVFPWGKPIKVVIEVDIPPDISRDHLSVAFSIKDLKGTDLIVSTTHDSYIPLPSVEKFSVTFSLTNSLVTGKYLLVAAVENRQYRDIHYYEYYEGAHYFSSLSEQRYFGIFQPTISQRIVLP